MPPPLAIETFDQAAKNRWCKFFPHRVFPDHDVSIYIDGNIKLMRPLDDLLAAFLSSDADIGLFKHPSRTSVAEELAACVEMGKLSADKARIVADRLRFYGATSNLSTVPFTENGIIFRRHAAPHQGEMMELWWKEYNWVFRDQIALPWVLQQTQIKVGVWNWSYRTPNLWFLGPVIPHLANLPAGAIGRLKLFLKVQKLQHRRRLALRKILPPEVAAASLETFGGT